MSQSSNFFYKQTYKSIWEAYPDAVVITDHSGQIKLINNNAEELFGSSQNEITGSSINSLVPDLMIKVQHGLDNTDELELISAFNKDQTEFHVNVRVSPLKINEENLIALFIRDLTAKENLAQRFQKMVEEIQNYSIVFLDTQGNITNWNKGVERILGYSVAETIGKNHRMFFSKKDTKVIPEMLLEKASLNGCATHEGWLQKKDGSLFWASIVFTAIYNDHQRVMGFSTITRDLTERVKAEELVRSQAEELQEKNKELENFTYIASHDLQEPLSTVTSMIELIREENDKFNHDTEEYFSFIEEAVDRMRVLIKGLLKYSRLGRNRELVTVNTEDLIEDVQVDLRNRIKAGNATIKIMDNLPEIPAFAVELRLLFQNIIGNALKFYSPERSPLIKIYAKEYKSYWKFSIKDNGIGIKENYLTKIFIIFQRMNAKSQYEGEGIGLAHCKKIVDLHDGNIWAESEFGKGTTFFFTISKNLKLAEEVLESAH